MNMKRISLMLPTQQIAELQEIKHKLGPRPSEQIRRAIDEYLARMRGQRGLPEQELREMLSERVWRVALGNSGGWMLCRGDRRCVSPYRIRCYSTFSPI